MPSFGAGWNLSPEVARSLVGIFLLALGAVTLIALALPGQGTLTTWWRDSFAPWFGTGRWLLPFVLLGAGVYVERARGTTGGWQLTLFGAAVAFGAILGMLNVVDIPERSGGRIGSFIGGSLDALLGPAAAFVILVALALAGLLIMLDTNLRSLLAPIGRGARGIGGVLSTPPAGGPERRPPAETDAERSARARTDGVPGAQVSSPGQAGLWPSGDNDRMPVALPSPAPVSQTFAPARSGTPAGPGIASERGRTTPATAVAVRDPDDVTDVSDSPRGPELVEYELPPLPLLEDGPVITTNNGDDAIHHRNEEIIVRKLASFDIPAQIIGRNAGPVVTQYEVQPAQDIKISRIEALADDLAMALAARSLRIEAPIPGKSALGVEIPNKDFNIVSLRRILEEVDFTASGSKLTFALGRDVAGHAQAVDLAKMPHLLIAGATGSGKSVMVNALITSLLCESTPDDVRMILTDLKRVELAAYNGLPHLLVPVITETERAKAALKWAVNEMENRYRRFAGASARNVRAYNDSRADPADRLPYIVIIVDELADLMMREGKHVEDSIVRLAQKSRATGIHMVLATQRPSVNVVTGLIKANFPSRIAFAMASQIDSRTILDTPGAEDLIGRGDMLYQPSDLPRPMRLQGVFVSDAEIGRIVGHWKDQIDDPHYDIAITESDEDGVGTVDDLADEDADRLLSDAVDVIREYDRASASLLQRRLKIGYARAARIIDQLEARGYIGAFDGSNARQVLRRDAGPPMAGGGDRLDGDDE